MGLLFASGSKASASAKNSVNASTLNRLECRVCTLNHARKLHHPKMVATGSKEPLIYIIGEAPEETDDKEGYQFAGDSGDFLRPYLPGRLRNKIRWNNTIRCFPGHDKNGNVPDPDKLQIECCRPGLIRDIEQYKPAAIFGLGAIPLAWADKPAGIKLWRGRRFPIQVGSHACWYYVMQHPSFILNEKKENGREWGKTDIEVAFGHDVRRAIREIEAGLPVPVVHSVKEAKDNIHCVNGRSSGDLEFVVDFLDYAGTFDFAGVDYETTHLRPYFSDFRILTAAVSVEDATLAFGWSHAQAGWTPANLEKIQKAWLRFLHSKTHKAVHNLSFEMEVTCYLFGWEFARSVPWEDTLTQAYVKDERVGDHKPGALSLEFTCLEHFGINVKKLTSGLNKGRMKDEPLSSILLYNGIDAKYHRFLFKAQKAHLEQEGLIPQYEEKLEQIPTAVLTQLKGMPVDRETNEELEREYKQRLANAEAEVQQTRAAQEFARIHGRRFNPLSASQDVPILLRDVLGVRASSTRKDVLKEIKDPVANAIIKVRETNKLYSTYVEPFSPAGGLVFDDTLHASFGTCFTETGRLQCEDPNLQNLPVRNKESKRVRRQIRKRKGIFAKFDYGQIDARMIACGSRDKAYCKALWEDYDIHLEWAKRLAKHHPDWVGGIDKIDDAAALKTFRGAKVKNDWVFALFYTASLRTTAHRFGVTEEFMDPMYKAFWKQFAGVKKWQETLIEQFEELGYVQLLGGLRRHAPLGHGKIVNTPIQGATNRVVMDAMNRLSKMGDRRLQANLQLHDDLSFIFDTENDFEECAPIILDTMLDGSAFPWICVPLSVEIEFGPTWADTEPLGTYNSFERLGWPIREQEFM